MKFTILLDFVWLLLVLLFLIRFLRDSYICYQTKHWAKTSGLLHHFALHDNELHSWPDIKYQYFVAGKVHHGSQIFAEHARVRITAPRCRGFIQQLYQAYLERLDVDVFYDPLQPDNALLKNGVPPKLYFIIAMLGCFLLLHIIYLVCKYW